MKIYKSFIFQDFQM